MTQRSENKYSNFLGAKMDAIETIVRNTGSYINIVNRLNDIGREFDLIKNDLKYRNTSATDELVLKQVWAIDEELDKMYTYCVEHGLDEEANEIGALGTVCRPEVPRKARMPDQSF